MTDDLQLQEVLKRAKASTKNINNNVNNENNIEPIDTNKFKKLEREINLNTTSESLQRKNNMQTFIRNTDNDKSKTIEQMIDDLLVYLKFSKSTILNRLKNLVDNSLYPEYFRNGRNYKKVPLKYQGLVYKLLIELSDSKSRITQISKPTHDIKFTELYEIYKQTFDIIQQFKNTGKQVCYVESDGQKNKIFEDYFYYYSDLDLYIQLKYINNLNYSQAIKDALEAIAIAMTENNNERILQITRNIKLTDDENDFISDILQENIFDSECENEREQLNSYFFDDNEFNTIFGYVAGGFFYTIQNDLTNAIKDYYDLLFFCDESKILDMYDFMYSIIEKTQEHEEQARKKINGYLNRYKSNYQNATEEEKTNLKEEFLKLKREVRKSEIAKKIFNECKAEENCKF